jgi:hypothetical protein
MGRSALRRTCSENSPHLHARRGRRQRRRGV